MTPALEALRFDEAGLIPAICQDGATNEVLLLAYMNQVALERTLATGEAHFWSRSRQALWRKGETSGNTLHVERIRLNCEANSLLLTVSLAGPGACHDGYRSCFYRALALDGTWQIAAQRTFDPGTVYALGEAALARDWQALYAGYERLRDGDYGAQSGTSRLLHDPEATPDRFLARAAEELEELVGVLDGTHQHHGGRDDVLLESSQVGYWLCLAAVVARYHYREWQPDMVLLAAWQGHPAVPKDAAGTQAELWGALTRLGTLLARAGVHPAEPTARDLASLKERLAGLDEQAT